jgi:hypothetical protein
MVNATWPELEHCGKAILAIVAVCTPFLPFMGRKWPGRICNVGGWLLLSVILLHWLGV